MRELCALPCVAVFNDGVVAVVESTIVVARTLIWQDTAITLWLTREDITDSNHNDMEPWHEVSIISVVKSLLRYT